MAPRASFQVQWDVKTVIAYAVSTGAHPADGGAFVYEGAGPRVLPSFASALSVRWLPLLNRDAREHWGPLILKTQEWELLEPLPPAGVATCEWAVTSVAAAGRNTAITVACTLEANGRSLSRTLTTLISRVSPDGLEPGGSATAGLSLDIPSGDVSSDTVVQTSPQQTAIFRLTLALDPAVPATDALHIDLDAARAAGFDLPPLHGPAVEGLLLRSVLGTSAGSAEPTSMQTRFRRPLVAGAAVGIRIWRLPHETMVEARDDRGDQLALARIGCSAGSEDRSA